MEGQKTFFLRHAGETRKVVASVPDFETLLAVFKEKFADVPTAEVATEHNILYEVEDRDYKVPHKMEQVDDIYDGAIVEVKARSTSNGDDHNKRELDDTVTASSSSANDDGTSTSDRRERERDTTRTSISSSSTSAAAAVDSGKRRRMELSDMKIERAERKIEDDGKHIILIRGLHSQASRQELLDWFDIPDVGEENVFYGKNPAGNRTGDVYIQFRNDEEVEKALKKHKDVYGRRELEVFKSNEEEKARAVLLARPWSAAGKSDTHNGPTSTTMNIVRMRGLPWQAEEQEVKDWFGAECPITAVHFMNDHNGRPNGDAFLEVDSEELQRKVLTYHKKHLGTRYIELFAGTIGELNQVMGVRPQAVSATSQVLRMRGLPWSATEREVKDFCGEAIPVIAVHFVKDNLGRSLGDAFIEVETEEQAKAALELSKRKIGQRYIDLFRSNATDLTDTLVDAARAHLPGTRKGGFGDRDRNNGEPRGIPPTARSNRVQNGNQPFDRRDSFVGRDVRDTPRGGPGGRGGGGDDRRGSYAGGRDNFGGGGRDDDRDDRRDTFGGRRGGPPPPPAPRYDRRNDSGRDDRGGRDSYGGGRDDRGGRDSYRDDDRRGSPLPLPASRGYGGGGGGGRGGASDRDRDYAPVSSSYTAGPTYGSSSSSSGTSYGGGGGRGGGGGGGDRASAAYDAAGQTCLQMKGIPFSSTEPDIIRFFGQAYVSPVRIHRKHSGGEAFVEFGSVSEANRAMTCNKATMDRRYIDLFPVSYDDMSRTVGLPKNDRPASAALPVTPASSGGRGAAAVYVPRDARYDTSAPRRRSPSPHSTDRRR